MTPSHINFAPAFLLLVFFASPAKAHADSIHVAVASNFANTLRDIIQLFEQRYDHRVMLSTGSTGKHYGQIVNGAPFDLFFAADERRPQLLDKKGLIINNSRFTYARGRLVLWSQDGRNPQDLLRSASLLRLAVANPRLAPYGRAAQETLQFLGLWEDLQLKLVRGENIGQTYHFVHSGSAQLGFVALSQLRDPKQTALGSFWLIPEDHYSPIEQQVVRLTDKKAAKEFMDFVKSPPALAIIERYGYGTAQ